MDAGLRVLIIGNKKSMVFAVAAAVKQSIVDCTCTIKNVENEIREQLIANYSSLFLSHFIFEKTNQVKYV